MVIQPKEEVNVLKRDMELMRKILLAIEKEYIPGEGAIYDLEIENYNLPEVAEHCRLLHQSKLINDYEPQFGDGTIMGFAVGNLTNQGYDYLEQIRNEQIWDKTKEEVKKSNLPETVEWIGKVAGAIIGEMGGEFLKSLARQ